MSNRPTGFIALWQDWVEAFVRAAAASQLVIGRDCEMVGWCTEEEYEADFVPLFRSGVVPPAAVWRVKDMVALAHRRLEERCENPRLPVSSTRVPVWLKENREAASV